MHRAGWRLDEAAHCYQAAISLDGHFAAAQSNLGNTFADRSDFDQAIAADQGLSGRQIEFPIVPIAGEHRARPFRAFAQRIAFMRTTIGDGIDAAFAEDEQDLLAVFLQELAALLFELRAV